MNSYSLIFDTPNNYPHPRPVEKEKALKTFMGFGLDHAKKKTATLMAISLRKCLFHGMNKR